MKKGSLALLLSGAATTALIVILGVNAGARHLLDDKVSATACSHVGVNHRIEIHKDLVTPSSVGASLCDRLTIVNLDIKSREIAFGQHDNHFTYDGISQRILRQNQSLTVTLNKSGSYIFHDHFQDTVGGRFVVR